MGLSRLIIRADASTEMGTGHVMRMLALAQAWRDRGGQVTLASAALPYALAARLRCEGVDIESLNATAGSMSDAAETVALASRLGASWVVLDGYHFSVAYQQRLRAEGARLLLMDDLAEAPSYAADAILNQNVYASESMYQGRVGEARLFLGTRHALLRREFTPWRDWVRPPSDGARRVLVTLGGGDPDNQTGKVVQSLGGLARRGMEARVIVGSSNPHLEQVRQVAGVLGPSVSLLHGVSEMAEHMAWADVVVSGAGATCWELLFMGMPSVLLTLAENQRQIAECLAEMGVAVSLGWYQDVSTEAVSEAVEGLLDDPARRRAMSEAGRALVDGRGAERVVSALTKVVARPVATRQGER